MANYLLSKIGLYNKKGYENCGCDQPACIDLETNASQLRNGRYLSNGMTDMASAIFNRYNNVKPILVVGDTVEIFEVPTYAALTDLSVFHDCPMGDYRFEIEVANIVEGVNCARTATARAGITAIKDAETGTTVTNGTAPVAFTGATGATVGRDHYHFGGAVRNNHRAVVRLKVTAAPAAPAAGAAPAANFFDLTALGFHASFERYAPCVCAPTCQGAYDKTKVATIV